MAVALVLMMILQWSDAYQEAAVGSPQVPAMFVFGDSLVDVGNNNFLSSFARANYYPYGIDFSGGPTGRFTNGRNIVDLLGALLGLPYVPAFADPNTVGARILGGVNYASAAGGILDETGQHYGERYSLSQQVLNFETTMNQLRTMMGGRNLTQYLAKSIAVLVFGSNDYLNNYLMPSLYPSRDIYNPPAFANLLLNRYATQILALHSIGLRKFALAGIGPLGCIPNQRASSRAPEGRCMDDVNQMLGTFNEGLKSMVKQYNADHQDATFVFGNVYGVLGDMLNTPDNYGFKVIDSACCGIGRNQGQITCLPLVVPCSNRNQYLFWDAFHPTEVANAVLAWRAYNGSPNDCYPINIEQLALI
ncbi:hypothetical protein FNV43_RR19230 [Rhamnella rubrinervis]|uniref:Uncharacterized protein n=1 Tax=Rhamnella rubrinervis TaxID=2594499 RepID=A0A8K0E7S3_9ROSA|nr:hypothetical protein FNV43_RR19230 [Rhamnella rubrinervis]